MGSVCKDLARGAFDVVSKSMECLHARTGIGHLVGPRKNAILVYHAIGEDADHGYFGTVSTEQFRLAVAYASEDAEVVPLTEFDPDGTRQVVITVDDGLKSFYSNALPVLEMYDVPATVFVNPAFVDDRNRELALARHGIDPKGRAMLSDDELVALAENPLVSIGNHTLTHRDLSTVEDEDRLHAEVVESKGLLEDRYGIETDLFSYPYGNFDDRPRELVEATHDISVTTDPFLVDPEDTHLLPRIAGQRSLRTFRWELSAGGDKLNRLRYRLATAQG